MMFIIIALKLNCRNLSNKVIIKLDNFVVLIYKGIKIVVNDKS